MSSSTAFVRANAHPLQTLAPYAPFDDLEPLCEWVGDARVIAIGESAHFVQEFNQARQRLLHFLAERCGCTLFAFEFGFSEGFVLAPWLSGEGAEEDLATVSPTASAWGGGKLLRFLRRHNLTSKRPLSFAGIDIPEAGGSLLPALAPVAAYLREVDPESVPLMEACIATASQLSSASVASAAPIWAKLETATQDALTASLARLLFRFRAMAPLYVSRSTPQRYAVSLRCLEAACHADYMLRAMAALFAGKEVAGDVSVRDLYMAESVRWHVEHAGPGARLVVAAHNNHIQKTPVSYGGQLASFSMGHYLKEMFGKDYVALALTSTADHIPEMYLDESAPAGFRVKEATLPPPLVGSIEEAVLGGGVSLGWVNLREAPKELNSIRSQSAWMQTSLQEAFDGVLVVPTATMEKTKL